MGQTFEKLSLLKESRPLREEDFEKSTFLEATGEMFSFTDAIM
jgi:DNA polymerase III delta subunit